MPAAIRKISILVSDSCVGAAVRLKRRLPALRVQAEVIAAKPDDLRTLLADRPVNALILGQDEFDLAADISERSYAGVLILADQERFESLAPACISAGILLAQTEQLEATLPSLLALCERLRSQRDRANSLRRQLDDTRVVSRAKLLLMSRLKMSESEAHRYIEKTAMDSGIRRREVAEGIIRAYEE